MKLIRWANATDWKHRRNFPCDVLMLLNKKKEDDCDIKFEVSIVHKRQNKEKRT